MRPFPRQDLNHAKKIFNYRLSRARRCIECAFGILRAKWRFLATEVNISVKNCEELIKAACLLHNIIIERFYDMSENLGGENNVRGEQAIQQRANRGNNISLDIRNKFMNYFNSPSGEVPWQRNRIN